MNRLQPDQIKSVARAPENLRPAIAAENTFPSTLD
jgi:hypothetical protein